MRVRYCPACWQTVEPHGRYHTIRYHLDSLDLDECPGTGLPFRVTLKTIPLRHRRARLARQLRARAAVA